MRKSVKSVEPVSTAVPLDTSDEAMAAILKRLKETDDPHEIRELSDRLERVIFHKQFENA